ncbi:DUF2505 domain-containing protein [Pseudomonas sp. N040]|uniref:DUF2505 domain-containing protein n=1 Tax=Pseudomonas sp. N040 TaxID=2785325 RepID=UPI0018A2AB91|nr:DUF2505 domain-containing protein [Pseudomonas sp. N040]MBF7728463.1 DUF2505 domain-containing protein [Pseudomonas sp. N040]MBW7012103.1 DUF2505 domain-containing protein [Pseudomonas sp. N040]
MKVSFEHKYSVDVDSLFALFQEPDFILERYLETGALSAAILEISAGEEVLIRVEREVQVDVPAFLRKFMQPTTRVVQTERWRGEAGGPYVNDMQVEISGTPVQLHVSMELLARGKGCVNRVEIEARCGIPLIGGKIADFVGRDAERTANLEYEFIKGYLKRR